MTGLIPLAFEGQTIRTVRDEQDLFWFIATDVCRALGLAHVGSMLRPLDDDERGVRIEHTAQGMEQPMATVSEAGVYKLVGRSRKPQARRFDRWVRHEVLPEIRRTGGFGARDLRDPRQMVALAAELAAIASEQQAQIAALTPRAAGFDRIADGSASMTITEAAKALQFPPRSLGEELRDRQWCYRAKDKYGKPKGPWLAYQTVIDAGFLEHKVTTLDHNEDPPCPARSSPRYE